MLDEDLDRAPPGPLGGRVQAQVSRLEQGRALPGAARTSARSRATSTAYEKGLVR